MAEARPRHGDQEPTAVDVLVAPDPQRDTPAVAAGHAGVYHPGVVGLTGPIHHLLSESI